MSEIRPDNPQETIKRIETSSPPANSNGKVPRTSRKIFLAWPTAGSRFLRKRELHKIRKHLQNEENLVDPCASESALEIDTYPQRSQEEISVSHERKPGRTPAWRGVWILVPWLVAGVTLFLLFQGTGRELALTPNAESEDEGREAWESILLDQEKTIQRLKGQLADLKGNLPENRKDAESSGPDSKEYRDEVFQLALRYQDELDTLQQTLAERETMLRDLGNQLAVTRRDSEQYKELAALTVMPPAPKVSEAISGKVITVNSRYAFIIVDAGSRHGVRTGQGVRFLKNGKTVARGKVEQVYPGVAGVSLFDALDFSGIVEGDSVMIESR